MEASPPACRRPSLRTSRERGRMSGFDSRSRGRSGCEPAGDSDSFCSSGAKASGDCGRSSNASSCVPRARAPKRGSPSCASWTARSTWRTSSPAGASSSSCRLEAVATVQELHAWRTHAAYCGGATRVSGPWTGAGCDGDDQAGDRSREEGRVEDFPVDPQPQPDARCHAYLSRAQQWLGSYVNARTGPSLCSGVATARSGSVRYRLWSCGSRRAVAVR